MPSTYIYYKLIVIWVYKERRLVPNIVNELPNSSLGIHQGEDDVETRRAYIKLRRNSNVWIWYDQTILVSMELLYFEGCSTSRL
jgi:hypothetical protein